MASRSRWSRADGWHATSSTMCGAAMAMIVLSVLSGSVRAADDPEARLDPRLQARLQTLQRSEEIPVNVVLREQGLPDRRQRALRRQHIRDRQQTVLDSLAGHGFRLGRRHANVNGFSIRASREAIDALARHPLTERIYEDGRVHGVVTQGSVLVGADHAHAVGVTGTGVSVAILDSGVDTDHPHFTNAVVEERCWCRAPFGPSGCCPDGSETQTGAGSAEDAGGHGTNVAGVLQSPGGVAPDAGIVALRVLDDNGAGYFSDIDAALDWLVDNHLTLGVRVVNLSLGDQGEYSNSLASPCSGTNTANLIANLHAADVAVFSAAGNDGHDLGISFPACVPEAISVGGVYDAALGTVSWCGPTCSTTLCTDTGTAADAFVCHSNSDELLDLLAPDWRTRTADVGGGWASIGGTSMATPYAAGLAALLFEQDAGRTPAQVLSLLTANSPMVTNPENGLSFPRVDVEALFAICSDGVLNNGEDCDDGNSLDGDCCSSTCAFETSGTLCDDGDACTTADACDGAGACGGSLLPCDDGMFCNGDESCDSGSGCESGAPPPLDDGIACTIDLCDEQNDVVTHTPDPLPCSDGLFCTGPEVCDAVTGCGPGLPPPLDDGVGCTVDSCDEANDLVVHAPEDTACDDGQWCNGSETCDVVSDCQPGTPPPDADGVICTVDICDEDADLILHTPDDSRCDDGDPCTAESCDAVLGCVTDPTPVCQAVPTTGATGLWITALALMLLGVAAGFPRPTAS